MLTATLWANVLSLTLEPGLFRQKPLLGLHLTLFFL